MEIGKIMKELREERGLTRPLMASKLGITASALWKLENGRTWPKKATVDRFCAEAKIPLAYLYIRSFTMEDFV